MLNISPNIRPRQLSAYFVCRKAVYCSRLQLFHFNTFIHSLFAKIHSPSLSKPALRRKILSLFQTYLDNNFCLASISGYSAHCCTALLSSLVKCTVQCTLQCSVVKGLMGVFEFNMQCSAMLCTILRKFFYSEMQ